MKILLAACNAKYIHSNLAVYNLKAYANQYKEHIILKEYTINQLKDDIMKDIYLEEPDVICVSCYIWNISFVKELMRDLHKIMPDVPIWAGGPEVSFDAQDFLRENPAFAGVMEGEGEETFLELVRYYAEGGAGEGKTLSGIRGIAFREGDEIRHNGWRDTMDLSTVPFAYQDLKEFQNRIIYYESSRGCPFSCSYCLSSIDKRVRLRSVSLVKRELQFFLDHQVPQVKFVDRTFNCNHSHAMEIWKYLLEHDNGITNFHFEVEADILTEEELELLGRMRPGLVQLEIGVQSVNSRTLAAVNRRTDFEKIARAVKQIASHHNIHQHLDLIAGLPFEDLASFRESFNAVYCLRPQELQLGFLKVLKGSAMYRDAGQYGIVSRKQPPYEVLFTPWLSYDEILKLKSVEEMVEVYYNSQQFACTIQALEGFFPSPFELYEALAVFYERKNLSGYSFSRLQRLEFLREFAHETAGEEAHWMDELLIRDLYLRENSKTRPEWAENQSRWKKEIADFYQKEEQQPRHLTGYEGYTWKQMMKMTHLEHFSLRNGKEGEHWILFDYSSRDPLSRDARNIEVII